MTMTAEQKKIKRLEKQVKDLKEELDLLMTKHQQLDRSLYHERQWRMDLKRLMTAVDHEEPLTEYERHYY